MSAEHWSILYGEEGTGAQNNHIPNANYGGRGGSWSFYSGQTENVSPKAIVPVTPEVQKDPSLTESLFKIYSAKKLTQVPVGEELSKIDRQQQSLINFVNGILRKTGWQERASGPFAHNIEHRFQTIEQQYQDILPEKITTPTQVDRQTDDETRKMILHLEGGVLDRDYETTEDERKVAYQIREQIGILSPEELRRIFIEYVYGRAGDIVRARIGNGFAYNQQELTRSIHSLNRIKPEEWFTVDLLTNGLMIPPEERKAMQNTIWTVTPTKIHVRSIDKVREDFQTYNLADLTGRPEGISIFPGTTDYGDKVRSLATGLLFPFRPFVDKWVSTDTGGVVYLRSLGRGEAAAKFTVREPQNTASGLQKIAGTAREVTELHRMMTDAIRNPEAAMQYPIRPAKIRELLPDPIVLQMGVIAYPNGDINYGPAIREMEQRKKDLQETLRVAAIRAAVHLDENGEPSANDQRTIASLERAITRAEETQDRLNTKNSRP